PRSEPRLEAINTAKTAIPRIPAATSPAAIQPQYANAHAVAATRATKARTLAMSCRPCWRSDGDRKMRALNSSNLRRFLISLLLDTDDGVCPGEDPLNTPRPRSATIDRYALHASLSLGPLFHCDCQLTILELGADLVRVDIADIDAAFEMAFPNFAIGGVFVLQLLIALEREHAIAQRHVDVLLRQTGDVGDDLYLFVRFGDINYRPPCRPPIMTDERCVEIAPDLVEQAIHLTLQREEWRVIA